MSGENGHAEKTRAVKLVEHFKEQAKGHLPSHTYRTILIAMGKVYRNVDYNIVDHAMREVLKVAKDVDGVTERELLDALIIVFRLTIPVIYPDQFDPIIILAPDGSELWRKSDKKEPPALPAEASTT